MFEWASWHTVVPLILGAGGLILFTVYSAYISPRPLIARGLFNTPTAIVAYAGTVIQGLIIWSILYYMPLYFEVAKNYGPIKAGIAQFPYTFTVAPAAVVVGFVISKTGRYRPSLWIGWFLTTFGMGLLTYLHKSTNTPSWVFLSLVGGIGLGMLFSAQGFAAQASTSNADLAFSGAMYSFFRALGQTLGVAVSGTIFQNTFKRKILSTAYRQNAALWSRDASSFVQIVKMWSNEGDEGIMKAVMIEVYVEVYIVMTVLAFAAFVASLIWTAEMSLERQLETEQGFRYEEEQNKRSVMVDVEAVKSCKESSKTPSSSKLEQGERG